MTVTEIDPTTAELDALRRDYNSLGERLARRGVDIEALKEKAAAFGVAAPSWAVGTGGTRFARFPGPGEPRDIFDKLEDCAVIHRLTGATPTVSLHIPWDRADPAALRDKAADLGLGFDAINSNTFADAPGQPLSYKFGSLSHTDPAVRAAGRRAQPRLHRDRPRHRLQGPHRLDRRRLELPRPVAPHPRLRALHRLDARHLRAAPRRLAALHRAQDVRARLLLDRRAGLGHQLPDRHRARPQGLLPRRPRPPRPERQHRDDRRPPDPVRQARRLPLQRLRSMATTTSTPARSTPTACSWSSTSSSTPRPAAPPSPSPT